MSNISKKPNWMAGKMSECGNFRIDCALGVELKTMRCARKLTLMSMCEDIEWSPAKLSNYENTVGALTCPDDARVIEDCFHRHGWAWSGNARALSKKTVITDLTKSKAMLARWRNGDFSQESDSDH